MPPRILKPDESLESAEDELVYTEARLLCDPRTRAHASAVNALIARTQRVRAGQAAVWRAETIADARVGAADVSIDRTVESFARDLLHAVDGDRTSPRFVRYFASPPNEIIRLALGAEIRRVRAWPASLRSEPEPEVRVYADRFARDIAEGDAALAARDAAAAARADHRAREIVPLVDAINAARIALYAALVTQGHTLGYGRDWAARFFRRGNRRTTPVPPAPPPAPTPA